jgi:SprT protein
MPNYLPILQKYTSTSGAMLIHHCLETNPFHLKIVRPRNTKLGDYRYHFISKKHQITINNDLKADAFLFTMLHEIAHQQVQLKFNKKNIDPHGEEWKNEYRILLLKAIELEAFENQALIIESLDKIKSSSVYNPKIFKTLYSNPNEDQTYLSEINDGKEFIFKTILFKKIQKNRSRSLCLNTENNRQYLISNHALVMEIVD